MLSPVESTSRSSPEQIQHSPHPPTDRPESLSDDGKSQRTPSWIVSPTTPEESVPFQQPRVSSPAPIMGFSVFGNNTTSGRAYQEQVAWANSTQFRPVQPAVSEPQVTQTTFLTTEDEAAPESRKYLRHPRHMLEPWTAGAWVRIPWCGFGALYLILLLTGASAAILLVSDGTSLEDWKIGDDNAQPHVYVSVFEMIMNFLILFALANGVVIKFWRQLLHGTTLGSLHDTYESVHLWPAMKRVARLRFEIVAVASILTLISFTRGPLFQRALTLNEHARKDSTDIVDLRIAPHPLRQFFESNDSDPRKQGGPTSIFSDLVKGLITGNPLPYEQPSPCGDYCTGIVKAYTLKATCNSEARNINLDTNTTLFSIGYEQVDNSLTLVSVHKNTTSCNGDIYVQRCTLKQATSDIPIVITNGTIDQRSDVFVSNFYDEILPIDDSFMKTYWPLAFNRLFSAVSVNATAPSDPGNLEYTKCVQNEATSNVAGGSVVSPTTCSNSTSNPILFSNDPSVMYADKYEPTTGEDSLCGLSWHDPMPDMISKMQSLAFRTTVAMAIAPDSLFAPSLTGSTLADLRSNWTQQVSVTGYSIVSSYHVSPLLVGLGIALSLVGVAAILPLYYGFWEMGRQVSLNPLEIARAFGAPIMNGLDGNTTPGMIAVERGGMAVKYGALDRYGQEKRLRVEESGRATVRTPWQGELFG